MQIIPAPLPLWLRFVHTTDPSKLMLLSINAKFRSRALLRRWLMMFKFLALGSKLW
jgi:hypothetical protein